jgi:hypothetical protein
MFRGPALLTDLFFSSLIYRYLALRTSPKIFVTSFHSFGARIVSSVWFSDSENVLLCYSTDRHFCYHSNCFVQFCNSPPTRRFLYTWNCIQYKVLLTCQSAFPFSSLPPPPSTKTMDLPISTITSRRWRLPNFERTCCLHRHTAMVYPKYEEFLRNSAS